MTDSTGNPEEGVTIRLCVLVGEQPLMPLHIPSAVKDACSQCRQPVWYDTAQVLPAHLPADIQLWCTPCALADAHIGPSMIRNLPAATIADQLGQPAHTWRVSEH